MALNDRDPQQYGVAGEGGSEDSPQSEEAESIHPSGGAGQQQEEAISRFLLYVHDPFRLVLFVHLVNSNQ